MKYLAIIAFIIGCVAQWFVPGKAIYDSEHVIASGKAWKFRTEPVDPSDPFRGKYITLSFRAGRFQGTCNCDSGDPVYVTFKNDSLGFAEPSSISRIEPSDESYLLTHVTYKWQQVNPIDTLRMDSTVYFALPFDRFYLEETKAPAAETEYARANRDSTAVTYAIVKMGKGNAVLTDVMINEKSVVDIVKTLNEK